MARRPIEFRQVCAIARTVLQADPSLSDAEWKARTKDTALKQGYDYPTPEVLSTALTQVEYALRRTLGPRPTSVHAPGPPPAPQLPPREPRWLGPRKPHGWASLADLIANLQAYASSETASATLPAATAHDVLAIEESEALTVFWMQSHECPDRMALVRDFAEIAIVRPATWDPEAIRAEANAQHNLHADACFVCRASDRPLAWHHVIQVQHGGSNASRNRIALCGPCHSDIHPWLPAQPRIPKGWASMADMADPDRPPKRSAGFTPFRTWKIATLDTTCGYDREHVIRKGDQYLELELATSIRKRRCLACAARMGARPEGAGAVTEAEPAPVRDFKADAARSEE